MAEMHSFTIPAHHNIYTGQAGRNLRIDFSTPSKGINEETGLLLLVPGFGAHIDSNVYKKMRAQFSDQYNLVAIQCDYFGNQFMQSEYPLQVADKNMLEKLFSKKELYSIQKNPNIIMELLRDKNVTFPMTAVLGETIDEFADLSYMQAIDNITALEAIKLLLYDNEYNFNEQRVIGYGHSHGAYILHLSNIVYQHVFSYIIDMSGWMKPAYIKNPRYIYKKHSNCILQILFQYSAINMLDRGLELDLNELYKNYNGNAKIFAFQGDDDSLVNHVEKEKLIQGINDSKIQIVTKKDIDNILFTTNTHGLGANFFNVFEYAMKYEYRINESAIFEENYEYTFKSMKINIDSTRGLPIFRIKCDGYGYI